MRSVLGPKSERYVSDRVWLIRDAIERADADRAARLTRIVASRALYLLSRPAECHGCGCVAQLEPLPTFPAALLCPACINPVCTLCGGTGLVSADNYNESGCPRCSDLTEHENDESDSGY